jgi:TRAP-type C4-dicarboxylate transport system permease small subunit
MEFILSRFFSVFFGAMVIPLAVLLFAQWPLRDWLQDYSLLANDVAQILFALYMAVAVTTATRSNSHLAIAGPQVTSTRPVPRWRLLLNFLCLAPWALLVLWVALPQMWDSVKSLEHFGETLTPGYFIIRVAVVLLAALALCDGLLRLVKNLRQAP